MRLKDKVAIVTGGGSGFGRGIAELFAAEGAKVVVADINGAAARVCADAIGPGRAVATTTDVTKRADVDAMVAAAVEAFGGVDCLVNNAGITHKNQSLMTVTEDEFDRIYAVNVKSIYLTTLGRRSGSGEARRRLHHQHGFDGRRSPAAGAHLVQWFKGRRDHADEVDGSGAGAEKHPRQRDQPGDRRDGSSRAIHGCA